MLMLSRVCAEFHDRTGAVLFNIRPVSLNRFIDAPESIRQDPLFDMLVRDGSIQANVTPAEKKILENNPDAELPAKSTEKKEAAPAEGTAENAEKAETAENAEKPSGRKTAKAST